jgi:hypothetical protein
MRKAEEYISGQSLFYHSHLVMNYMGGGGQQRNNRGLSINHLLGTFRTEA